MAKNYLFVLRQICIPHDCLQNYETQSELDLGTLLVVFKSVDDQSRFLHPFWIFDLDVVLEKTL